MEIQNVTVFRILAVGLAAGLMFAVMDGLINANPTAQRLYAFYRPIVRESVNAPLGVLFDLVSGNRDGDFIRGSQAGVSRGVGHQRGGLRSSRMVLPGRDGIGVSGGDVPDSGLGPGLWPADRSG